ncbi:hypothetical protein DPEC_G00096920 [Dallia pectoralis]|uniref:Uncharacterized protein n=1 Tax=Dallia pectoralis TaxID=75939 RepID=A0ACC2GWL4_DALPE|nr:hypothetical protein DPEC_G00096920 [Dallia pectoralis]
MIWFLVLLLLSWNPFARHQQGALLGQHTAALQELRSGLQSLTTSISALQQRLETTEPRQVPTPSSDHPERSPTTGLDREPWIPAPERGEGTESHADTIITDQCVIRTVLWRVEEEVRAAQQQDPGWVPLAASSYRRV